MPRKTVLITGCSTGGMGEEMAMQFHSRGLRVFATARTQASMDALSEMGIETFELDVTKSEDMDALKTKVEKMTDGKLDILVNNAGICNVPPMFISATMVLIRVTPAYPFAATDVEMDKKFAPALIASGHGCIVNMGSLAGVMPIPFAAAYNASKAALHSYGDTLRVELAPFNVKVLTVVGGNVRTNLSKPWHKLPSDSMYQPIRQEYQTYRIDNFQKSAMPREKVVKTIVAEALKSNPSAWLWVGTNSWLCWFISTFLPRRAFDGLLSKMFGLKKLAALRRQEKKTA